MKSKYISLVFLAFFFIEATPACLAGIAATGIKDANDREIMFSQSPERIVCLAPAVTQMLVALGQENRIVALTRQDLVYHAGLRAGDLGGYFNPDFSAIKQYTPDLVICPPKKAKQTRDIAGSAIKVLPLAVDSIDQAYEQIGQLARLFDCPERATEIIGRMQTQLDRVGQRLDNEKNLQRLRVARIIGGAGLSCPGDDSFQNEMIRAAGGTPPQWGKTGSWIKMDTKSWQKFNPQVIYGCNANADAVHRLLATDGYKEVDAVKNGRVYMFPCELTCRVSTATGDFVQWLAAMLYPQIFADPARAVTRDVELWRHSVGVDLKSLGYVDSAEVIGHRLADTPYKSLVLRFNTPQTVLSTLNGLQQKIDGCGNTYIPMAASLGHMRTGVATVQQTLEKNLGFGKGRFFTLMTGADMDNLAVVNKTYKDIAITALVTAGVRGNAMRLSKDQGYYLSHGTINIIVAANLTLSVAAMSRAIITVTEAKTAALEDLDIRSSYSAFRNPATGTGTDNVLVVQGQGSGVAYAGGHSKIAQLMAQAVHEGVTRAIAGQNGIRSGRNIIQRLHERGPSLEALVRQFEYTMDFRKLVARLENLLAQPYYAAFLDSALAFSDARGKNLIMDGPFWEQTCRQVAQNICGLKISPAACRSNKIPPDLARAIGALIAGIESSREILQ